MANATPLVLLITEMPVRSKSSLLSEKYCPNYKLARRLSRFLLTMEEDGENILLSNRMNRKMSFIKLALQLTRQALCLVTTRQMEMS